MERTVSRFNTGNIDLVSSGYNRLGYWWTGFAADFMPEYVHRPMLERIGMYDVRRLEISNEVLRVWTPETRQDMAIEVGCYETQDGEFQVAMEVVNCARCNPQGAQGRCSCLFITSY